MLSIGVLASRKRLVIDACVAGRAGPSSNPEAAACRDFLEGVLKICHKLTWSSKLKQE